MFMVMDMREWCLFGHQLREIRDEFVTKRLYDDMRGMTHIYDVCKRTMWTQLIF